MKKAAVPSILVAVVLLDVVGIAEAQQPKKMPRIGLMIPSSAKPFATWIEAFRTGLRDRGYTEGKSIAIEYRYTDGKQERMPELVAELVRLRVDIIVTSLTPDTLAAKKATRTIPIVMVSVGDPVGSGFVDSLARPGGNITGLTNMASELSGKRLELLKEIVPNLKVVGILWNPAAQISTRGWQESQTPAHALGLQLYSMEVQNAKDFDRAFHDATGAQVGAVSIAPTELVLANQKHVADLAVKYRLPSIFQLSEYVDSGGLMAYGPDRSDLFRRAAIYVDKILQGRKPADLPVEQPMKFELVFNLKTAKQIGLTIPQWTLMKADKVIK